MKMVFEKYFIYLLIAGLIIACKGTEESLPLTNKSVEGSGNSEDIQSTPVIDQSKFVLYHSIDQVDLSGFRHFGDFFDNRLTFYYAENPGIYIGRSTVQFMMLYFIDSRLAKVRYHLNRDISNYLLDSLGMCKIKSSDSLNKEILKSGIILKKNKNRMRLNPELDDYELIWDRLVVESRFVADPDLRSHYDFDTVRSNYLYIDQLKSYKRRIYDLERNLSRPNKITP